MGEGSGVGLPPSQRQASRKDPSLPPREGRSRIARSMVPPWASQAKHRNVFLRVENDSEA